jgi:hypothetical protein
MRPDAERIRPGTNASLIASLRRGSLHVDLGTLSLLDTRVLLKLYSSGRDAVSRRERMRVERLGEGNPRMLLALLGAANLHELLEGEDATLHQLDPQARRFVDVAAVAGESFEISSVARVSRVLLGRALEAAQLLLERNIVRVEFGEDERLSFRRAIVRERFDARPHRFEHRSPHRALTR